MTFVHPGEHLHIQLQIPEKLQLQNKVGKEARKGGDTNPYSQKPAFIIDTFLTRTQSKVFHSESNGLFKVYGEEKERQFMLCLPKRIIVKSCTRKEEAGGTSCRRKKSFWT